MDAHLDLHSFVEALERSGELVRVEAEVDPRLEAAEIHRRVIAAGGPALLFTRPKRAAFPLVTNLFGTAKRVERAFGAEPLKLIQQAVRLPLEGFEPSAAGLWQRRGLFASLMRVGLDRVRKGPAAEVAERPARLDRLPALTTWAQDGGPFLTLPLVHTQHPESGLANLGIYRMQVYDAATTGMHFQIGKGGGFHLAEAEARGAALPAQVYLGGPPALLLAAIAPLPENVPELLLASLGLGQKLKMIAPPEAAFALPASVDFALVGEIRPGERRPEGPFGDHYGYYSLTHDYPVFHCRTLLRRKNALFPATVVGKPRQEDFFLGDFLQDLLSPLFPLVMPGVRSLWSYGETGYHSLAAAVVRERYRREAMVSAFRILGEGQLALTKFLLVTDAPVDLRDFRATLEHVLSRADLGRDLFVFSNLSMDTLDYTGPTVNEGSKGVLLGLGAPRRELPREPPRVLPGGVRSMAVFAAGCLVVDGADEADDRELAARLARDPLLRDWPLVVLVDDAEHTASSPIRFLWATFTRFEPAADIFSRGERLERNHRVFEAPVVIDARRKPGFPEELFCDPETAALVTRRWKEYFPRGMEMGSSDRASL